MESSLAGHLTGLCMIVLAAERFILVLLPFQADTLPRKENRVWVYMATVAMATTCTVFEASYQLAQRQPVSSSRCWGWINKLESIVRSATLLPAAICTVINVEVINYFSEDIETCVCWIVSRGLAFAIRFSDEFLPDLMPWLFTCFSGWRNDIYGPVAADYVEKDIWTLIPSVTPFLAAFSSLMNAICLLIVCNKFW